MDDDDLRRLLDEFGLVLPEVEDDDDELPVSLDDLGDDDRERKPRDWRAHWERGFDEGEWE